jgi:tetratricopeptide (TPR) repeat protein
MAVSGSFLPTASTAAAPQPATAATPEIADDQPASPQPPPAKNPEEELAKQLKVLVEKGDDPAVRRDTAVAYRNVGDSHRQAGKFAEAEAAFARAAELLEKLVQTFPAERIYVRELAHTYRSRGSLYQDNGRMAEAERTFRQALALDERLVRDFPQDPAHREDLAADFSSLGRLHRDTGRMQEAEQSYRRALALLEQLAADRPKDAGVRQQLARTNGGVAELLLAVGRPAEAEAKFRQALALAERLMQEDPKSEAYRRDLAQAYSSLAMLMRAVGRMQEAEQLQRRALAILKQLAADSPETPEGQVQLARCYNQLGLLLAAARRNVEAEATYRQAIELLDKANARPAVSSYLCEGAIARYNLAQILRARDELPAAEVVLTQAITLQDMALQGDPKNPTYRRLLRSQVGSLADTLIRRGNRYNVLISDLADRLETYSDRPEESYEAATLLARCLAKLTAMGSRADAQRIQTLARAIRLLARADAAGFFKKLANRERLEKDKDLDALRTEPAFVKLLEKVKGE